MSQRTITNVRLPDSLTRWYFDNFENPMSATLSELLQLFRDVSDSCAETRDATEVLTKMRELFEEY
jgi:hypothetical protein